MVMIFTQLFEPHIEKHNSIQFKNLKKRHQNFKQNKFHFHPWFFFFFIPGSDILLIFFVEMLFLNFKFQNFLAPKLIEPFSTLLRSLRFFALFCFFCFIWKQKVKTFDWVLLHKLKKNKKNKLESMSKTSSIEVDSNPKTSEDEAELVYRSRGTTNSNRSHSDVPLEDDSDKHPMGKDEEEGLPLSPQGGTKYVQRLHQSRIRSCLQTITWSKVKTLSVLALMVFSILLFR